MELQSKQREERTRQAEQRAVAGGSSGQGVHMIAAPRPLGGGGSAGGGSGGRLGNSSTKKLAHAAKHPHLQKRPKSLRPSATMDPTVEGLVEKRARNGRFHKRWFALQGRYLLYWKSGAARKAKIAPLATIDLALLKSVEREDRKRTLKLAIDNQHQYELRVKDSAELVHWAAALEPLAVE